MSISRPQFLLLLLMLFPVPLSADELLQKVQNDQFLLLGNVGIVEVDSDEYVVAVGLSARGSDKPDVTKRSILEAKARAYSQLTKFIYGEDVSVTESLTSADTTVTQGTERTRVVTSDLVETIRARCRGPLTKIENVGSWSTTEYSYWVTGIKIPKSSN